MTTKRLIFLFVVFIVVFSSVNAISASNLTDINNTILSSNDNEVMMSVNSDEVNFNQMGDDAMPSG